MWVIIYTVPCTLYIVQCTQYSVQRTTYIITYNRLYTRFAIECKAILVYKPRRLMISQLLYVANLVLYNIRAIIDWNCSLSYKYVYVYTHTIPISSIYSLITILGKYYNINIGICCKENSFYIGLSWIRRWMHRKYSILKEGRCNVGRRCRTLQIEMKISMDM